LILLDTNVVVHYLKGDRRVVDRIRSASYNELSIPTIVVYELEYGTLRSNLSERRRFQLSEGLRHIQHVPFDSAAALAAAAIRIQLERQGYPIGPLDLLIAGTAVSRAATLVTNNAAEFSRVPGLQVMDWRSE